MKMKRYTVEPAAASSANASFAALNWREDAHGNVVLVRDLMHVIELLRKTQDPPQRDNPELYGYENGFHDALDRLVEQL